MIAGEVHHFTLTTSIATTEGALTRRVIHRSELEESAIVDGYCVHSAFKLAE